MVLDSVNEMRYSFCQTYTRHLLDSFIDRVITGLTEVINANGPVVDSNRLDDRDIINHFLTWLLEAIELIQGQLPSFPDQTEWCI